MKKFLIMFSLVFAPTLYAIALPTTSNNEVANTTVMEESPNDQISNEGSSHLDPNSNSVADPNGSQANEAPNAAASSENNSSNVDNSTGEGSLDTTDLTEDHNTNVDGQ